MKRGSFNKRILLGTLGVGSLPFWSKAVVSDELQFERVDIGMPKEHVRHGTLDLFGSSGSSLSDHTPLKVQRHRFFKNGFSAGSTDLLFVSIVFDPDHNARSVLLFVEGNKIKVSGSDHFIRSEISPVHLFSDDSLDIDLLNSGDVKLKKGDTILSLKGKPAINGDLLPCNEALCIKSKVYMNCMTENAVLVLVRSKI